MKSLKVMVLFALILTASFLFAADKSGSTGGSVITEEVLEFFQQFEQNSDNELGLNYCYRWEARAKSHYGDCWGRAWGQPSKYRAASLAKWECERRGCGPCMVQTRCQSGY